MLVFVGSKVVVNVLGGEVSPSLQPALRSSATPSAGDFSNIPCCHPTRNTKSLRQSRN